MTDSNASDAREEIDRLNGWVADLQSGMYVNCVYCGHRYGPGETTPVCMADALKAHIEQCPQHPMSALKREVARLHAEVDRLHWLIREGEKHFGTLWRQANASDIDFVRGPPEQSSAPPASPERVTLPGKRPAEVGGADLDAVARAPDVGDFSPGDVVLYVPYHAEGSTSHPDCENGSVESINASSGIVYVRFSGKYPQGCKPDQLVIIRHNHARGR